MFGPVIFLLILSSFVLRSISPSLFPLHFFYLFLGVMIFWFFSQVDFDVLSIFSNHLYIVSIVLLLITLLIGAVTRGTVRWIPLGPLSLQPAEIVRPLLLVFFANFLTRGKFDVRKIIYAGMLLIVPVYLILRQPSLGVSVLTVVGFFGVLIATSFKKKYILIGLGIFVLSLPLFWNVLKPYQKDRITAFVNPDKDTLGSGYNSLQSTIAVGSGGILGLGLGHGSQTQLSFLPEKQTDFIFAATAEELGFVGSALLLLATALILYRLTVYVGDPINPASRAFVSGLFLTYLVQVFVHVGMNMGMLPVTGIPFPLVSAGGSSLLATMMALGIASKSVKR